jgi:hypothetical protein
MAKTLLEIIPEDDYEKARFLSKRKFENDLESDKNTAVKIREYEIAVNLLKIGLSKEQISQTTGLTADDIEKAKALMSKE